MNYSVWEKEALAILWMLERHRYMLLGHDILLRSDHRPLRDLFLQNCKNARQFRWIERLLEFNIINFEFVQGKDNVVADCLSRRREECQVMTRSRKRREDELREENTNTEGREVERQRVEVGEVERGPRTKCPTNDVVLECGWEEIDLRNKQIEIGWIRNIRNFAAGISTYFPSEIKVEKEKLY